MRRRRTLTVWVASLPCVLPVLTGIALCADEPARKPPWQRLLQGEEARKAEGQEKHLDELQEAGKFAEALKVAEALAELRGKAQGADHWQAANARGQVDALRRVLRHGPEGRNDYARCLALQRQAETLAAKVRYREAQPLLEKVLAIRRQVLGEEHPLTATNYHNLASILYKQDKYVEAEAGFRKALDIRRKALGEDHPDTATTYNNLASNLAAQGKHAEAEAGCRKALDIWRRALGEHHPDTATSYLNLAATLHAQHRYREAEAGYRNALDIYRKVLGEEHRLTAHGYTRLAFNLRAQGKYAEAEAAFRKALAIRRQVLGEQHPDTAESYHNQAMILYEQGKHGEAEASFRTALAIRRQVLGEQHPDTATSYNGLAFNLAARGKYAEAEAGFRKALDMRRKLLGEDHPATAISYNDLAATLQLQGRYVEAVAGFRKALAILRKMQGEGHPSTAMTYMNMASNLYVQGRFADAEVGFHKALDIYRKALGEEHPDAARAYDNLANNAAAQDRYAEAEGGFRKALDMRRKLLGEDHPATATSYQNLANCLRGQGRHAEAEAGCRKALDICRKALGEEHPRTATCYEGVARSLRAQGKYAEAEAAFRRALDIHRQALGEDHLDTAESYDRLAGSLHAQGKYGDAEARWLDAADRFAKIRHCIAATGLERAARTGFASPLPSLAAVLARNGKPEAAWRRFEEGLARGTWDDLSARLRRPAAEQAKQAEFVNRLSRLDQILDNALTAQEPTPEQKQRREQSLSQRRHVQDELDAFAAHLEKAYGPAAGEVFDRPTIQKSLPPDAALIGWLDLPGEPRAADPDGEHWAVLLRAAGPPAWVRLRGTGPKGAWTDADTRLPAELRTALQSPRGAWQPLSQRLRRQRLEPLAQHLAAGNDLPAVRQLVVLPSTDLAGVPVEVFADGYTISYGLSGTLHAHMRGQPRPDGKGLLALADPVFDPPAVAEKALPLPPGGVLLTMVVPGSNAAQAGLKPNDVLLRYNGTDLTGPADLKPLPESGDADKRVPVTVWRDDKTLTRQVRPGKLGVVLASDPAPKALADLRRLDRRLAAASRGGDEKWEPLPGTRAEVEALRRLFGKEEPAPKLLLDSEASEQRLDALARGPELGTDRYIHLATHGVVDDRFPLRSAVILARDHLPDPLRQLEAGLPAYDGRLTAEEVLRQWHLKSDLVTLSACQTALGKYEKGEGFVGFAQALILAGSSSVCLSQWKVDDAATALLMQRFYQNLLGKRDGLTGPLPKAEALAEAKAWLRGLSRDEALKQAARLTQGLERGKGRPLLPLLPAVPPAPAGAAKGCPYAHPDYWAAFVLIGDPD
jgi:tetratricopeptide (TPR) repeat protein